MAGNRHSIRMTLPAAAGILVLVAMLGGAVSHAPIAKAQDSASSPPASNSSGQATTAAASPVLPRGKKLMLTDGSFQLVREYKVEGDRVRYYSLDSSQWEQIPVSMVDWDATKKIETEEAKSRRRTRCQSAQTGNRASRDAPRY